VTYLFVFLPLVLCLYQFAPRKARWLVLLLAGYVFLWLFDGRMALWLAGSSLFTHYICVLITLAREKQESVPVREKQASVPVRGKQVSLCKNILVFGIVTLLCLLGYVKYSGFFAANLNRISESTGILARLTPENLFIPIGISFYTLQAIGYMVDVYWGKAEVSTHPGKTALFLGFFPRSWKGLSVPMDRQQMLCGKELRSGP
jgi:D-alanyl-lipoteichoic acid acyltransferase DltB (MBOAT superfamily)